MKIWNIVEILSMGIFKSFTDNLFYNWTVNRFFLIDYGFVCINYVHMLDWGIIRRILYYLLSIFTVTVIFRLGNRKAACVQTGSVRQKQPHVSVLLNSNWLQVGWRLLNVAELIGQNCAPKITCLSFRAKLPLLCGPYCSSCECRGVETLLWSCLQVLLLHFFRGVRHGCCHNNHRKCQGDGKGRIGRKMPKVIPSVPGGVSQFRLTGFIMASILFTQQRFCCLFPWSRRVIWAFPLPVLRFQTSDGEVKYVQEAEELIRPERNTLLVSFTDLEGFNQELATTIQEEYYR